MKFIYLSTNQQTGEGLAREKGTMPETLPYGTPTDGPDMRYWHDDMIKYLEGERNSPTFPVRADLAKDLKAGDEFEAKYDWQTLESHNDCSGKWESCNQAIYDTELPQYRRILLIPPREQEAKTREEMVPACGKDKPFIVANVRDIIRMYDREEISMSRMVEILNGVAANYYAPVEKSISIPEDGEELAREYKEFAIQLLKELVGSTEVVGDDIASIQWKAKNLLNRIK